MRQGPGPRQVGAEALIDPFSAALRAGYLSQNHGAADGARVADGQVVGLDEKRCYGS